MRLTTDLFAYCAERIPSWNTISISGYHIREAGSTAVQELAFTLANGIAYCDAAVAAGLSPDEFGERLSFFFNAHNDFFQEVAKFRAARRLWARVMRERFGATNPKALALRFHAQTGGSTLTAQQPENNIVRVAIQALSAICGGAQSLHTNSFDEALALPTERAATIALRTQQILQAEAGTTDTADPLGGSYYIEALTDELEARASELIERIDEIGGAVAAIEQGFVQGEIERAAFEWQQQVERGERVIVGVNRYAADAEQRDRAALDRPGGRAAPARADREGARRAQRRRGCGGARARARRGARDGQHAPADARRAARALHGRRDLRRPPRGVGRVRSPSPLLADPPRLADVPGAGRSRPRLVRRAAEHALRERGHEIELAVLDRRGGGKRRFLELRRRSAPPVRTTSSGRTSSCRRARSRSPRAARSSSPRTAATCATSARSPASPRDRAGRRARVDRDRVSDYLRRELEDKLPAARGKIEVVDSGVDLERFRRTCGRRRARVAGVRPRRLADGAQERRAPRRRVRAARPRLADLRRRRAAALAARRPRARARRRPRAARRRARLARRPPTSSARRR